MSAGPPAPPTSWAWTSTDAAPTDHTLDVLVQAWTSDTVTHRGHRVHTAPRPVQDPHPPLWIGGNGPRALERVNPIGTTWHPLHPGRQLCARAAGALADGKQFARGSSPAHPHPRRPRLPAPRLRRPRPDPRRHRFPP
ncbi:LLM class flavin-dependent oxidoreductase [Streptomyces sp. NPDC052773]|uniref:LLM class flavin-dependent oxidoreductase n=1 Tax=Streptomyces sp. NPDC052773 TaxID=3365693 RepID=UPI0037D87E8F